MSKFYPRLMDSLFDLLEMKMESIKINGHIRPFKPAPLPSRWMAQFLDEIIITVILFALVLLIGLLPKLIGWVTGDNNLGQTNFEHLKNTPLVDLMTEGKMLPAVFFLYWFFQDGLKSGQSFGKRMLSIRVINSKDGTSCTYRKSFLRNLLLLIPIINFIDIGFMFGKKQQRLGDMLAGTYVVKS